MIVSRWYVFELVIGRTHEEISTKDTEHTVLEDLNKDNLFA